MNTSRTNTFVNIGKLPAVLAVVLLMLLPAAAQGARDVRVSSPSGMMEARLTTDGQLVLHICRQGHEVMRFSHIAVEDAQPALKSVKRRSADKQIRRQTIIIIEPPRRKVRGVAYLFASSFYSGSLPAPHFAHRAD